MLSEETSSADGGATPPAELRPSPTLGPQREVSEEAAERRGLWVGPGSKRMGPESSLSGFHRS